jgi:predicted polyphosphate/ATP-dependent NAD kinase
MGQSILKELQFEYQIIDDPLFNNITGIYDTNAIHTKKAAQILMQIEDLLLIIFVGGDGTARDIMEVIDENKPCLGVPAGVKMYSSVFSLNPTTASNTALQYLWDELPLVQSEVLDIDEKAYRKGNLISKIYGYLLVPNSPLHSQYSKLASPDTDQSNQERIADKIVADLEKDVYYLLGPGTTVKAITDKLHLNKTLLGVDLLFNGKIIAYDLNEQEILSYINQRKTKIIISLIGRQGFLFGRGNLQFTPKILKLISPKDIIIVATKFKIANIPDQCLRIDSRDIELDNEMKGLYRVITDYDEMRIIELK